jgi:hypothetical protein
MRTDSSALRKNLLVNDTPDDVLVERLTALWDSASVTDAVVIESERDGLVEVIEYAFSLRDASPSTWEAFLGHPLWTQHPKRRPKPDEQHEAPKHAFAVFFGNAHRAPKKTSDYWRAFQQLEHEEVERSEIVAEMIQGEGHIRKLCTRHAESRRQASSSGRASSNRMGEAEDQVEDMTSVVSKPSDKQDASTRRQEKVDQQSFKLVITSGQELLKPLVHGQRGKLMVEVLAGGGSELEVKLIRMKPCKAT